MVVPSVIPAPWEAKIEGLWFETSLEKIVTKTLS
jgi:hypothetical protein